jgi:hypothetical protein
MVFNNFNSTTHPEFTKFYVDECCEVHFSVSAQDKEYFIMVVFQLTRWLSLMMVVAATEPCRNIELFCDNFLQSLNVHTVGNVWTIT